MEKTKATYSFVPIVEIRIKINKRAGTSLDNTIVKDFFKFLTKERIYARKGVGYSDSYFYGSFLPADADKVRKWLQNRNTKRFDSMK